MSSMLPASLVLLLNGMLCLLLLAFRAPDASLLIAALTSTLLGALGLFGCGVQRFASRL